MYYELYVDVFFLVNFMMDFLLLLITRKILKCSATHGNICLGSLVGSLLTCFVVVLPIRSAILKLMLFHIVINVLMIYIGLVHTLREIVPGMDSIIYRRIFVGRSIHLFSAVFEDGQFVFCRCGIQLLDCAGNMGLRCIVARR